MYVLAKFLNVVLEPRSRWVGSNLNQMAKGKYPRSKWNHFEKMCLDQTTIMNI